MLRLEERRQSTDTVCDDEHCVRIKLPPSTRAEPQLARRQALRYPIDVQSFEDKKTSVLDTDRPLREEAHRECSREPLKSKRTPLGRQASCLQVAAVAEPQVERA